MPKKPKVDIRTIEWLYFSYKVTISLKKTPKNRTRSSCNVFVAACSRRRSRAPAAERLNLFLKVISYNDFGHIIMRKNYCKFNSLQVQRQKYFKLQGRVKILIFRFTII